ncbi:MAG: hypothetical protein HOA52_06755 [Flavobacteriales bacterium]|nr:hypothetical protein [Flavobacteriales bacterium]
MDLVSVDSFIQNQDFLKETTSQLEKDFLMVGVNFDIEKPVESYKDLFSFTFNLINSLNERDPKRLLNLLYRIDLDEEKVKLEMNKTELSFTEMLSEMIVKRELYKVIIRKKIS